MKRFLEWFYSLTGGRPMMYAGWAFTDRVTGRDVFYWIDRDKLNHWMAESRWSLFRVERQQFKPPGDPQ